MDINTVCTLLIDALKNAGYNDTTIFNYQGAVRRFKTFCNEHDVTEYSYEISKLYADSVISPKTGKFSKERYHLQGRFVRLIDSYIRIGQFDFSTTSRSKVQPENTYYQKVYTDYCSYLEEEYENENPPWSEMRFPLRRSPPYLDTQILTQPESISLLIKTGLRNVSFPSMAFRGRCTHESFR